MGAFHILQADAMKSLWILNDILKVVDFFWEKHLSKISKKNFLKNYDKRIILA